MEYKSQILDQDSFKGNYFGSGKIILNGKFEGNMTIDELIINEKGYFSGKIVANNIIVFGSLKADVEVEKIHIKSNGILDGDLLYRHLIIEEGAFLRSSKVIKMSDDKSLRKFKSI